MGIIPQRTTGTLRDQATLNEALRLAAEGRHVLPTKLDKSPHTQRGFYDATDDPDVIREWYGRLPGAGIGMKTGMDSGVIVADFDLRQDLSEAMERGLPDDRETTWVRSMRDWHVYFEAPDEPLRSRRLGPGLELKAEGAYVIVPPSAHPDGKRYRLIPSLSGKLAPVPDWMLEAAQQPAHKPTEAEPLDLDPSGPAILDGERDNELTRIAGGLHDGTRTLDRLTADLLLINEARCLPPLPEHQVAKVARSIHHRPPCRKSAGVVEPEVLVAVAELERIAGQRGMVGTAALSNWATYRAVLELARHHGRLIPGYIRLSDSVRQIALKAGQGKSTTSRSLNRLADKGLLLRDEKGHDGNSGSLLIPIGHVLGHPSTVGSSSMLEVVGCPSMYPSPEKPRLFRLRHGMLGKLLGVVLERVAENPGITRKELAEKMKRKPDGLKRPLRELVELGLVERVGQGSYRPVEGWERRLERERVMRGEAKAERLDEAEYRRQTEAYGLWLREKKEMRQA